MMVKLTRSMAGFGAALLCTAAFLAAPARAADPVTLPGRGVGRIFLGMQRDDVIRSLGNPYATFYPRVGKSSGLPRSAQGAYVEDEWMSANGRYELQVVYRRGRVAQIRTDNPQFAAADNLSVQSPMADARRHFPGMTAHAYLIGEDDAVTYYADSVKDGIAFEFATQDDIALADDIAVTKPLALIVHEAGSPVLPIYEASAGGRDDSGAARVRAYFAR